MKRARYDDGASSSTSGESHSSFQESGMYPANTTRLDVDLVNPVMAQEKVGPQTFNQRIDPTSFNSPNMMVNTSNSAQMMSMNTSQYSPGMMIRPRAQQQHQMMRMNTSQYPPGMMIRPRAQQQHQMMRMNTSQYPPGMMIRPQAQQQNQMMRMNTSQYPPEMMIRPRAQQQHQMPMIPNRMTALLNMQPPQLGSIRYPSTYDSINNWRTYNRLPSPGSSSVGQNLAAVRGIGSNVNRPFLPPYNTSLTPGPYQHMAPFYPSESDFSRHHQAEQSNPTASQSISTVASSVISSATLSHQQQVQAIGVTSTAPTSNPNSEISDNHQSSTANMQAVSVSSSLPSSNTFAITTSTNMISSGVTTNGVANSVSSTSSMSLQQSSISDADQMGLRGMVAGGSAGGVGGAGDTGLTNPQSDPEKRKHIQQQLNLLLHAHKCQRQEREQADNPEYQSCTLPHCRTFKNVLNHMTDCPDGRACQVPHCASSRQIISHWKNCNRPDCPVCQPLKSAAPTATRDMMNLMGGVGSSGRPDMEQFMQSMQPMQGTQLWHQDVSPDLRQHLIRKLVTTIHPVQNQNALQDPILGSIIQYAKKVEKSTFEVARSKEQYYELLAGKLRKIQIELQERILKIQHEVYQGLQTNEGHCFENLSFNAFDALHLCFKYTLENHSCDIVRGWCKQYCDEHWRDENLNWNVSSTNNIFDMLNSSSYHSRFNPGLLKHLANKSGNLYLINTMKNYEKKFSNVELKDVDVFKKIIIAGNDISTMESDLIASTLLDNYVTVGELWNLCTPRLVFNISTGNNLVLDASTPLLNFYNSIKDDKTFLAKAKQENQVIDFQHIKILLTGSAAVGKTSFCRLLFQSKYSIDYKSTEVMEAKQAISIVNFSMLKQETDKKEVVWFKLDPKNQIAHFRSLLKSRAFHQTFEENSLETFQEYVSSVECDDQDTAQNLTLDSTDNMPGPSTIDDINIVDEVLTDVEKKLLSSKCLPENLALDKKETVKLITVIDSGGQPEYIHMLPAINNCPTINFVVLDMTKHLDDPVMVQYKSKHGKNFKDYPLHYSNLDMIGLLMSLTTDSLEQPTKQTPRKTRLSIPNKSYIGFVGTHKDKLEVNNCKEAMARINSRLTDLIEERDCKFAVLSAEDDSVLFPVDNTTAGDGDSEDPVVKILRQRIETFMDDLTNSKSANNQLPITWMILELELQELHQNNGTKYITYEEYKRIATEKASMVTEEVEESLQHFDILGVFLHFKKVEGLCDYVIIDHQWLFDSLAMIVHLSPDNVDFQDHHFRKQFKQKRLLAKSEMCITNWDNELCPELFFNLLIYLKIIATVMLDKVEYYYMPCIHSSTIQYEDKYRFLYSEPLLVQFSSGFLPRGFFCSLVVHLLQNLPAGWDHQLHNTEHFSNVITFQLPDKSFLRLHDKTSYLEVQVRHYEGELCISDHSQVLPVLSQYFKDVCNKLCFNHDKLQYGFLCHDGKSNDDHIAIINQFPLRTELKCCRNCLHPTKMGRLHRIWFEEIAGGGNDDVDLNTFQCCTAADNLRKNYAVLSDLPYNSMERLLYAKKVITREEKKCIKTLVGSEKMECLLDVVIRSLKHNHCHKFKGFLEAMEESDDMLLKKKAKDLGGSEAVPTDA